MMPNLLQDEVQDLCSICFCLLPCCSKGNVVFFLKGNSHSKTLKDESKGLSYLQEIQHMPQRSSTFKGRRELQIFDKDTNEKGSSMITRHEIHRLARKTSALCCSLLVSATIVLLYLWKLESHKMSALVTNLDSRNMKYSGRNITIAFTDVMDAFSRWDDVLGCKEFQQKHATLLKDVPRPPSLQDPDMVSCDELKLKHVSILVKSWTWIPDSLNNLYSCRCGLTCMWTKSTVLADNPEALLYELHNPPLERKQEGLRVYMDLEPARQRAPSQDIFISYHASDDLQATYAGGLFHNSRSYYISRDKNKDILVYWSSSRCLKQRQEIAQKFLSLVPHHSFGKCLNNVGGKDEALSMYPECRQSSGQDASWNQHLHCAMSHYKFVLAIENTFTESYVTEKLFYALDAGSVPIYFGAPNVMDFVPPHSIIDGHKFNSMEDLSSYVKKLANDPVAYSEYHAWRRCGVMGNYYWTRAASLDSLPCRLCAYVSKHAHEI